MPTFPSVTYFTIADSNYFLGAAALINSLELTGNHGSVVVVDAGLEAWQRERLRAAATVIPLDAPAGLAPTYYKSYMGASITGEVLVYFDSDIIVTDSLGGIISLAASGRICAAPDTHSERFFPEWSDVLPLAGALRRQVYVNAGFLALAPARWPGFYRRWKELCDAMLDRAPPMHTLSLETALRNPRAYHDQDALNAMLMTELPPEALAPINGERVAASREMARVRCVDPKTLDCRLGERRTLILHYLTSPKPWQRSGWITASNNSYVRLLARLLGAEDVPIPINDEELPVWLRGGIRQAALMAGIRGVRATSHAFPAPVRRRVRGFLSGRRRPT